MLVFDNGNVRPGDDGDYSRIVEFELDEENMTAAIVDEVDIAFVEGHGDADLLPGEDRLQYVIGWGSPSYVTEISWPGGEALWTMSCPEVHELYRVTFFPSIYERNWWYTVNR